MKRIPLCKQVELELLLHPRGTSVQEIANRLRTSRQKVRNAFRNIEVETRGDFVQLQKYTRSRLKEALIKAYPPPEKNTVAYILKHAWDGYFSP